MTQHFSSLFACLTVVEDQPTIASSSVTPVGFPYRLLGFKGFPPHPPQHRLPPLSCSLSPFHSLPLHHSPPSYHLLLSPFHRCCRRPPLSSRRPPLSPTFCFSSTKSPSRTHHHSIPSFAAHQPPAPSMSVAAPVTTTPHFHRLSFPTYDGKENPSAGATVVSTSSVTNTPYSATRFGWTPSTSPASPSRGSTC